jgi:hypothetical protein
MTFSATQKLRSIDCRSYRFGEWDQEDASFATYSRIKLPLPEGESMNVSLSRGKQETVVYAITSSSERLVKLCD